jgi:CHASE3 domain sensor protein
MEMNATRFPRPILLPLLALPIILVSVTLSYLSLRAYEEQNSRLEQTRLVLRITANLREELRRAESSQRGLTRAQRMWRNTPANWCRP